MYVEYTWRENGFPVSSEITMLDEMKIRMTMMLQMDTIDMFLNPCSLDEMNM
jgi:hypothetical protein